MSVILSTLAGKIVSGVALAAILALIAGGVAYHDHLVRSEALAAAQAKQIAAALKAKDEAIADRNRIWAEVSGLPEVRLRLCAQRGPLSGCCKPEPAKCEP